MDIMSHKPQQMAQNKARRDCRDDKTGEDKKGDWLIIDGGLKSGKILKEARYYGVKLVTRLNSNFVVKRFGTKYRKEDVLSLGRLIERTMDGTKWIVCSLKRCIWQGSAGNMFLVKGFKLQEWVNEAAIRLIFHTPLHDIA